MKLEEMEVKDLEMRHKELLYKFFHEELPRGRKEEIAEELGEIEVILDKKVVGMGIED